MDTRELFLIILLTPWHFVNHIFLWHFPIGQHVDPCQCIVSQKLTATFPDLYFVIFGGPRCTHIFNLTEHVHDPQVKDPFHLFFLYKHQLFTQDIKHHMLDLYVLMDIHYPQRMSPNGVIMLQPCRIVGIEPKNPPHLSVWELDPTMTTTTQQPWPINAAIGQILTKIQWHLLWIVVTLWHQLSCQHFHLYARYGMM